MAENPLFDGSDLSLGGDGAFIEDFVSYIIIPTPIPINITGPTGTGGGCVTSGPFANMSINLGPHGAPISDGFSYNPRCLTRNFRNFFLQDFMSYEIITAVLQEPTLQAMQDVFEGTTGLHSGGHTGQGGLQDDLWGSAQDPSFHFHHAAVDRIWSIWQAQNQTVRTQEVASTLTIHDRKFIIQNHERGSDANYFLQFHLPPMVLWIRQLIYTTVEVFTQLENSLQLLMGSSATSTHRLNVYDQFQCLLKITRMCRLRRAYNVLKHEAVLCPP